MTSEILINVSIAVSVWVVNSALTRHLITQVAVGRVKAGLRWALGLLNEADKRGLLK